MRTRRVALGVCGGIAAYKAAELARLLAKQGYQIDAIMTPWATHFLGQLTLEAITLGKVRIDVDHGSGAMDHITLMRQVDLLVIAPATANTLSKLAHGVADNFLTAAYLARRGPVLICPAMNAAMMEHPATVRNLATLRDDGVLMCLGADGQLACGEEGPGRLAEPGIILEHIERLTSAPLSNLVGKRVCVTAGPTCEDLDPVRYLTNRSSGRMGFALARAFRNGGAHVTLISGPTRWAPPQMVDFVSVRSAAEMHEAVLKTLDGLDLLVMNAAVADYRPPYHQTKLKKAAFSGEIKLERCPDVLTSVADQRGKSLKVVGFAAETDRLREGAEVKLKNKKLDAIVVNQVGVEGRGFDSETNQAEVIWSDMTRSSLPLMTKTQMAGELAELIHARLFEHP